MPREPDKRIVEALELYRQGKKLVEIASQLDLPEGTVRRWKSTHKWDSERSDKKKANAREKGGQPGNTNATGPPGNKHAEKHGFFTKWLPAETMAILNDMSKNPLDLLWDNIQLQYAVIIRAQNIMYVKDQEDKTIEKVEHKEGSALLGEKWEVQQAWDKHATFMSAQSRATTTFLRLVKEYEEMAHKSWDMLSEEQKARIDQIKAQTKKLADPDTEQPINITFTRASDKHDETD